jgi:hypothetical protein
MRRRPFTASSHLDLVSELVPVVLLAIIDLGQRLRTGRRPDREQSGVALPISVRWGTYGISSEVYEAVHELAEFSVIELNDPMPARRRGKFRPLTEEQQDIALPRGDRPGPVPYRFIYDGGTIFARPAAEVITTTLRRNPDPPRLASHRR